MNQQPQITVNMLDQLCDSIENQISSYVIGLEEIVTAKRADFNEFFEEQNQSEKQLVEVDKQQRQINTKYRELTQQKHKLLMNMVQIRGKVDTKCVQNMNLSKKIEVVGEQRLLKAENNFEGRQKNEAPRTIAAIFADNQIMTKKSFNLPRV